MLVASREFTVGDVRCAYAHVFVFIPRKWSLDMAHCVIYGRYHTGLLGKKTHQKHLSYRLAAASQRNHKLPYQTNIQTDYVARAKLRVPCQGYFPAAPSRTVNLLFHQHTHYAAHCVRCTANARNATPLVTADRSVTISKGSALIVPFPASHALDQPPLGSPNTQYLHPLLSSLPYAHHPKT
jgi:hypothetical protein